MKALSLFSGIGGIDLAAEWAEIETIAFCENEPFCQKILKKHWKDVPIFDDVKTLTRDALEKGGVGVEAIDIIFGGFPCQPYSIAGKRQGKDDGRALWTEMFRVVKEIKPTWVVGENVSNFARMALDETLSDLESIGYETATFILPACAIGATHRRDRLFIVAHTTGRRWSSMEESGKIRCDWLNSPSYDIKNWRKTWSDACNVFATGTRILNQSDSDIHRNDDGLSQGMDRLRGLGNAVMPQQIFPLLKAIKEIHDVTLK